MAFCAKNAALTPIIAAVIKGIDVTNNCTKLDTIFLMVVITTLRPLKAPLIIAIDTCAAAATTLKANANSFNTLINASELVILPSSSITGWNAAIRSFCNLVPISWNVIGISANFAFVSSALLNNAFLIMSAVIRPCELISFNCPTDSPISCAILCANIGAFSIMERNSSPCNLPAAIACVNWYIADVVSCTPAPAILNCLFNCSTK